LVFILKADRSTGRAIGWSPNGEWQWSQSLAQPSDERGRAVAAGGRVRQLESLTRVSPNAYPLAKTYSILQVHT